jgi:hypothetical protein
MLLESFVSVIQSYYDDAVNRGFDSIIIAIDTGQENTYYINDTPEGFQCDFFDYVFDDIEDISVEVWERINCEEITEIRIE